MKLLLAVLILSLPTAYAQAFEITVFILVQPLSHVRAVCAAELVPDWGCRTFKAAVDDPTNIWCIIHLPTSMDPWDRPGRIEALRPLCLEHP